jgi:hypothetical protein
MYYLADIIILRNPEECLTRIVKAKDKNSAYTKIDKYMREVWLLEPSIKYKVNVHDTIE